MRRNLLAVVALSLALPFTWGAARPAAIIFGPTPGLTGNDTGGIINTRPTWILPPMTKLLPTGARAGAGFRIYQRHRRYGDYVSFICIDRPGIHG